MQNTKYKNWIKFELEFTNFKKCTHESIKLISDLISQLLINTQDLKIFSLKIPYFGKCSDLSAQTLSKNLDELSKFSNKLISFSLNLAALGYGDGLMSNTDNICT